MSNSNNEKAARHKMINPRMGEITKNNALLPGGPDTNTPITSIQSEGAPVRSQSVYLDHEQNDEIYSQLGTRPLDPTKVGRSQLLQANAVGQRLNAQPFNTQQQFDLSGNSPIADLQESNRLAMNIQDGLPVGSMGLQGSAAVPAGLPGDMPGTNGPNLMPGNPGMGMQPMNSMGPMTPGADKKVNKPKKGKK